MAKEKNSSSVSTPTKASTRSKQSRLKVVSVTDSASSSANWTGPTLEDLDQEIRLRAYEFYCERGGLHGAHEEDWHRAEQEVREKYEKFEYGT